MRHLLPDAIFAQEEHFYFHGTRLLTQMKQDNSALYDL